MKYHTQKIALAYFTVAMALFAVQVTIGLLMGWIYVEPNFLSTILPFNIARMLHTNSTCKKSSVRPCAGRRLRL